MNLFLFKPAKEKSATAWGDQLVIRRTPESQVRALDQAREKAAIKKSPLALQILQGVALLGSIIFARGILESGVSFAQGFENAPELFYAGGGCILAAGILTALRAILRHRSKGDKGRLAAEQSLKNLEATTCTLLGVPRESAKVDLLSGRYKVKKNGQPKLLGYKKMTDNLLNPEFWAFIQDGKLYLAHAQGLVALDLDQIQGISRINQRMSIPRWNKEVHFTADRYKPYKLMADQYGMGIYFKPCYALDFTHQGQACQLIFPPYELPVFQALIGKKTSQ